MRYLALAVGHGGRNAIAVQAHPAHAKGRTRAETANGNLQVLRKILPIARDHAGYALQRFRQIDPGLGALDI